ncbi:hypothetical protein ElyMa_004876300 [Elysia marginata]|uniref:Uncharacterized protein n=1 Tax=Elysia marginata TaxID=1093978 RepID=A0AAV4IX93_9GAST|nr:hypothetical protein ElyMa_004876300 [Elysia marginata]
MPKLTNSSNVVVFLADDIIREEAMARSYLEFVSRQGLDRRSPASLVITRDVKTAAAVFKTFSRHQSWLGSQSGIDLYTKWLVVMPHNNTDSLEKSLDDFYNVVVTVPNTTSQKVSASRQVRLT